MGHIKEPAGVNFIINGKPLTEKEKKAISEFIKADKKNLQSKEPVEQGLFPGQKSQSLNSDVFFQELNH